MQLVAKGFSQQEGIAYEENFAPTTKMSTIRLVLNMTTQNGWKLYHMDMKSVFLNGDLEEEVYMYQPQVFQVSRKDLMVYRVKKALYGWEQTHRARYIKTFMYLDEQGFHQSPLYSNMYVKKFGNDIIILIIYVDNIIITCSEANAITQIKFKMNKDFDMTYLGLLNYCLDVEVWKTGSNIFVPKTKYGKIFLDKFRMRDCKLSSTPMEKGLKLSARTDSKEINESVYK
jgi:hypothetical protein